MVKTRQSDLAELCPFRKQSEMRKILDSFEKKESKKNKPWFWDQNQNRKYSIVLKQSICNPVADPQDCKIVRNA